MDKIGYGDWEKLRRKGVILPCGEPYTYIDRYAVIEEGTVVWPTVFIFGDKTMIGRRVIITPGSEIHDSFINNFCMIRRSIIENSKLGESVAVGPYSWVQESVLGHESYVGCFNVLRRSSIGRKVKIPYHAELADTNVGDETNIAKGFTASNFNGLTKRNSQMLDGCFIGTDVNIDGGVILGSEVRIYPRLFITGKRPITDHSWLVPCKCLNKRHDFDVIKNSSFKIPGHQRWICFSQPVIQLHILKRFLQDTGKKFSDTSEGNKKMAEFIKVKLPELNLFSLKMLNEAEVFGPEDSE